MRSENGVFDIVLREKETGEYYRSVAYGIYRTSIRKRLNNLKKYELVSVVPGLPFLDYKGLV